VDIEHGPAQPGRQPFRHTPVLLDRIVALLAEVPDGTFVDATLGGAGHAAAVLDAHPGLRLLGLDRDPDAIAAAAAHLERFGDRVVLRHTRFDRLAEVAAGAGMPPVTAVLFDLGVSSPQLDRGERGFSHRHDAPLDMRMDTTTGVTAADVVNGYAEADLARVLRDLGDERYAARIARAIVAARPVTTTGQLADLVRDAIPAPARRRGGHPAKRSFQAIRIEVNAELEILPDALDQAVELLTEGGRCAVLAYHSGEDRIVKARFREAATGGCTCPVGLPCACGATPTVHLLRPGAWKPATAEVEANPRAASARLRVVEKLGDRPSPDPHRGSL
jgi:16S rRNA (cytosine1402-N4)-methyltransferase